MLPKVFLIYNTRQIYMLYNTYFNFWHYICSGKRENKFSKQTSSLYPNKEGTQ